MIVTKIKRLVMKPIDGSNNVRYSALVNGNQWCVLSTDGIINKHLTKKEFKQRVLDEVI